MNAPDSHFAELADTAYTELRRKLLRFKGSDLQREFLMIVRDSAAFQEYFKEIPRNGTAEAPLAPYPMTESEYKEPPSDTENTLYAAWSTLTPSIACRSTFWANLTLAHISEGRIQSVYLAANGGTVATGAERIDFVLRDDTARGPQRIDSCVRTQVAISGWRAVRNCSPRPGLSPREAETGTSTTKPSPELAATPVDID